MASTDETLGEMCPPASAMALSPSPLGDISDLLTSVPSPHLLPFSTPETKGVTDLQTVGMQTPVAGSSGSAAAGDATGQTPLVDPFNPEFPLATARRGRQGVTRIQRAKIRLMLRNGVQIGVISEWSGLTEKTIVAISKYYGSYKKDADYIDEVYVDPRFLEKYPAKPAAPSNVIKQKQRGKPSVHPSTPYPGPSSASTTGPARTRSHMQPAKASASAVTRKEFSAKNSAKASNQSTIVNTTAATTTQLPAEPVHVGLSVIPKPPAEVESPSATQTSSETLTSGDTNDDLKVWLTTLKPRNLSHLYLLLVEEGIDMVILRHYSKKKREDALHSFFLGVRTRLSLADRHLLVDAVMELGEDR